MKALLFTLFISSICRSQPAENIIIITTDGFRWQEVFKGMDSAIANDKKFNQRDSTYIFDKYWAASENERRQKLLPFFWSVINDHGQLYGNRTFDNRVDNANPYWFSYPGYSEILTGFPDTAINSNEYPPNPHTTVLEFLNAQSKLKGKVVAFGAWNAFNRILNEQRSGIPVYAAFDTLSGSSLNGRQILLNEMLRASYKPWHDHECLDVFTHYAAMEELRSKKPKVLYIAYGETDEWAHAGQYRSYLDAAHQVDSWIKDLWTFLQADPQYRNKTAVFITTDHGRGDIVKTKWTDHGNKISDAHEIWFAVMGPGIQPSGEVKSSGRVYQKQFAQTIAKLMGYTYKAAHPIAEEVKTVLAR